MVTRDEWTCAGCFQDVAPYTSPPPPKPKLLRILLGDPVSFKGKQPAPVRSWKSTKNAQRYLPCPIESVHLSLASFEPTIHTVFYGN